MMFQFIPNQSSIESKLSALECKISSTNLISNSVSMAENLDIPNESIEIAKKVSFFLNDLIIYFF